MAAVHYWALWASLPVLQLAGSNNDCRSPYPLAPLCNPLTAASSSSWLAGPGRGRVQAGGHAVPPGPASGAQGGQLQGRGKGEGE